MLEKERVKHGEMQVADFYCNGEFYMPATQVLIIENDNDEYLPNKFAVVSA